MDPSPITPGRIGFDQFEADLRSGELRKNGRRIRLQPQPFQFLALLLERPGEVVTREELCGRLWRGSTFVDFDHGLGTAVKKIREALGDSAENPRFVETLPRRGYRFIGSIRPAVAVAETEPQTVHPILERKTASRWEPAAWILALSLVALMGAYAWWNRRSHAAAVAPGPVPFTAYTGLEVAPSFSPDGSQIAFSWTEDRTLPSDGYNLYVKAVGNENAVRLTNHPSRWISSAWSPDGSQIAIHRVSDLDSGLYLVPARGGPERKMRATYAANSADAAISWSPDGQSIAFSDSPSPEGKRRLQIFSMATSESTQIPHDENCKEEQIPAFSHDGKQLAYICSVGWEEYGVAVLDLQQDKPRILKTFRGWARGLLWARNDKFLIFSESQVGDEHPSLRELHVADAGVRPLEYGQGAEWPALSPRGDRLAYDTYTDGHNNIWRLDLTNLQTPPVELISSTREQYFARYSPDGTRIAFTSTRGGDNQVWMSNAEGKDLVQLTTMGEPSGSPSWSPDGTRIAFDSRKNGRADIYLMDLQERIPHKLNLTNVEEPSVPSWSRDGKWIYFIAGGGPNGARIYRAAPEGGDATPLSTTSGYGPVESFDGERVFFAIHNGKKALLESASLKPTGTETLVTGMPVLSFVANWAIVRDGVYFFPAESLGTLSYFDFATKELRPVYDVGRGVFYGLSISADGRYAIYAKIEDVSSDIMLINNFR
jgi:Tol biopolymer transport system component/DNA-binding winged helix-turn-helix (wHTH) protein